MVPFIASTAIRLPRAKRDADSRSFNSCLSLTQRWLCSKRADHRNEVHRTLLRGMDSGMPKRRYILIVEDELIVRLNACDMFEDAGFCDSE